MICSEKKYSSMKQKLKQSSVLTEVGVYATPAGKGYISSQEAIGPDIGRAARHGKCLSGLV